MDHLHLSDRIKKLDIATIEKMSPEVMAMLTDSFNESLVRKVLYIGTTNPEQRRIIRAVKGAYKYCRKDDPYWGNPPLFPETYPQYLEEFQMDIECGLVVTPEGTIDDFGNKVLKTLTSSTTNTMLGVLDTIQKSGQTGKDENMDNKEHEEEEIDDASHTPRAIASDNDDSETLKGAQTRIKELEEEVGNLKALIDDYSARFDPKALRKKEMYAMTGKQHVIFVLAVLASHDKLPNSRKTMSFLMSFIASRSESTMEDYLGDAISKDECDDLATIFDHEKQPFLAKIIRELPEKLGIDKRKKNRAKPLKKHND